MLYSPGVSATFKVLSRFHDFEHISAVIYLCPHFASIHYENCRNEHPRNSKAIIDDEFRRMKNIAEIRLSDDIKAFLNDAHSSMESKGASNPRGPCMRSLIHYAAMGDCPELLRCLLRTGAAKDDRDQNKRTPLSWAAEYGALNSVNILLEHGANINSTDDTYSTPLSWLIHAGPHTEQAKATEVYLRKNGAKKKSAKRCWILRKIGMF
jgi:ankyrin repeat protein